MHLVQIQNATRRCVAVVREPNLVLLREVDSTVALAERALSEKRTLSELAAQLMTAETVSYGAIYDGKSEWKLLPPIDCAGNPHRVHVSGTGLTHLGSARDRQAMHVAATAKEQAEMTDSMRMFEWGRQQGRPASGEIGIAPEWFYKGDGSILQAPFGPLPIPGFAEDGGEEAEVAAIYMVADDGTPCELAWLRETNFPTTSSNAGTISTWPVQSSACAASGRNWLSMQDSTTCRELLASRETENRSGRNRFERAN